MYPSVALDDKSSEHTHIVSIHFHHPCVIGGVKQIEQADCLTPFHFCGSVLKRKGLWSSGLVLKRKGYRASNGLQLLATSS